MNWQEKFAALKALKSDVSLLMRRPGDWYVGGLIEIGGDAFLRCPTQLGCEDPAAAVNLAWDELVTTLPPDRWLTVDYGTTPMRWNGFMWAKVPQ